MKNIQSSNIGIVLLLCALILPQLLLAQHNLSSDSIVARMNRQVAIFPQEKIYIHNDKPVYITGEKIWFRAHLANSYFQKYDSTSIYVYGELVNPLDSVVDRVKIRRDNELYAGHFSLKEEYPAGTYSMRFYTKFMESLGDDYFFKKNIEIGGPFSSKYQTDIDYSYTDSNKKLNITLQFKDSKTKEIIRPKNIAVSYQKEYFFEVLGKSKDKVNKIKINAEQKASFSIDVEKEPVRSIYVEYEYKGDNHSEFISVGAPQDDFHVDFFPEGGNLLSGVYMNIAFKALYSDGHSANISGIIYTEAGDSVTTFRNIHLGMGVFPFLAEDGQKYFAACKTENGLTKKFNLPQSVADGYTMTVQTTPDFFEITVHAANNKTIPDNFALFIHNKGQAIYSKSWNSAQKMIQIPRSVLPTGIIHCMLVNNNYKPVSERLVFNLLTQSLPQISLANNKQKYLKREKVISKLTFADQEGKPLNGNFSVSVTDNKDIKVDDSHNILTNLLLTSELKGYIENPSFYFKKGRLALYALDILMQTQGWRRYDMPKVLKGDIQKPKVQYEFSQIISGNVKNGLSFKNKVKDAPINLVSIKGLQVMEASTTDKNGHFTFNTDFPDSLSLMISTIEKKGITKVLLEIDKERYPTFAKGIPKPLIPKTQFNSYFEKADLKYTTESGVRMINLQSVEVVGVNRTVSIYSSKLNPKYGSDKFKKMGMDENSTLRDFLNRIGIWVDEDDKAHISMSPETATIVVDNLEGTIISSMFLSLDPSILEIESVEIVENSPLTEMMEEGAIILITTKLGNGRVNQIPLNRKQMMPLGYQAKAHFYSPKYETVAQKNAIIPDLRTTLYWNPYVKVEDGKAEVSFYTADDSSEYTLLLEGITSDGQPLHLVDTIGAEK